MITVTKQEKILGLLVRNEENVSRLYQIYAQKFPELKDFWLASAEEESEHSAMLKSLYLHSKVEVGMLFDEDRFNEETIQSFIEYTDKLIYEAEQRSITINEALSISLDLENSLLEKGVFEIFETDSPRFKKTLLYLKEETQNHVKSIGELKEKYFTI